MDKYIKVSSDRARYYIQIESNNCFEYLLENKDNYDFSIFTRKCLPVVPN